MAIHWFPQAVRLTLAAPLLAWLAACAPAPAPLAHTHDSLASLASAVLDGFARRAPADLRALALDEREFRELVWPELPAARPERNLPVEYVWGDLNQKSQASLERLLGAYGGERFTLVGTKYLDGTTPYRTYLVHRKTVLTVRTASGGTKDIRLFGSVIERQGRLKVFSYVANED